MDEDRLRELQNAVQEQLGQRNKERERNITKRVQEFEKTFGFVNSHFLKGVATMAELTKTDNYYYHFAVQIPKSEISRLDLLYH